MSEFEVIVERIKNLPAEQRKRLDAEYNKLGSTKKKWAAFIAGAIAASLLWIGGLVLFGCGQEAKAVQTGPNSACFPGPKVVE